MIVMVEMVVVLGSIDLSVPLCIKSYPALSAASCRSKAISCLASQSSFSVSASLRSKDATWSRCRARCRRWFSRTRLSVCSAETRERLVRGAVLESDVWSEEDAGDDVVGAGAGMLATGLVFLWI